MNGTSCRNLFGVAQIFNLPYRGIVSCGALTKPATLSSANALPTSSRPHSATRPEPQPKERGCLSRSASIKPARCRWDSRAPWKSPRLATISADMDTGPLCAPAKGAFGRALTLAALLLTAHSSFAQWLTQSIELKAGWNAVYFHVDASHATLSQLVDVPNNPIQEVWLWQAESTTSQFVDSPKVPTTTGSQWYNWTRSLGPSSPLQYLSANSAYLVRVATNVTTFTWNVKGKPVPLRYRWTTTGLNLLGFPTPANNAPSFESFLGPVPEIQQRAEIYRYVGGDLGAGNPVRVLGLRTAAVSRGEAFWIRSGSTFNRYFGPFEVSLQDSRGAQFGDSLARYQVRIRNIIGQSLTVKLEMLASEAPPVGQKSIVQAPPLLLRGDLDTSTLTYSHTNLTVGPQEWTLAPKGKPGSDVEIVLGIDRSSMVGNVGDLYAAVLRFTDGFGYSRVDIPVSAVVTSKRGLWVGQASVTQVGPFMTAYQRDADGKAVSGADGRHIATAVNTSLGGVVRPMPLRLILHLNEAEKKTVLMQRVFYGTGKVTNDFVTQWYANPAVSWSEGALLKEEIPNAYRISAVHLPFSQTNRFWECKGELKQGTNLTVTVVLDYDDQVSNPFFHTYHPDHDNLNATFDSRVPQGYESYRVERQIILRVLPPSSDFASLSSGSNSLVGEYEEVINLIGRPNELRRFNVRGGFSLSRLTDVPNLTPPSTP